MSTIQVGRVGRSDDANQELKVNGLKNVCKNLSTERDETISTVMFNLEQIKRIHDQLGKRATLLQYLRAVKAIGVDKCDSFISDGHSEYFGREGHKVVSSSAHEKLKIAEVDNREDFIKHLNLHSQRKTTYLEMSRGLADRGVEKWTFDTNKMTMTYYDRGGNVMLVEEIT